MWLCNLEIPDISRHLNRPMPITGGWITGLYNLLIANSDMQLCIGFPYANHIGPTEIMPLNERVFYFQFRPISSSHHNNIFLPVLQEYKPDVVQIWGTEFAHTLVMVLCCQQLCMQDRVVIHIQGYLTSIHAHMQDGLPYRVVYSKTIKDIIRGTAIYQQRNKFRKRSTLEQQAVKQVSHVIGRTKWDQAWTYYTNPTAIYHHCDEALRPSFYDCNRRWNVAECKRHSLFISQGTQSLKGIHILLQAMPLIINEFPDAKLYIGGHNILQNNWKSRIKRTYYEKYILKLIKTLQLTDHIEFTGMLSEQQMCYQLLHTHVAVSASSIENGSLFIAEAKILGVPVVASYVGGVTDVITHGHDGYFYQFSEYTMLAYYIRTLFGNDDLSGKISAAASKSAQDRHNRDAIWSCVSNTYQQIAERRTGWR